MFAAITAAADGADKPEDDEDGSGRGQKNGGGRVLVGDHIHGVSFCEFLDTSVVSTSASRRVVVLSRWVSRQLEVSELIHMLLLDGVNSHAHIDHPPVLTGRHGVRALVSETVVCVKVHESVCKSDCRHSWLILGFELQILKEVVDSSNTIFGAEDSGGAID